MQFCRRLLEEKAVAITPGIDFGTNGTDRFVRFAYAQDMALLKKGVERIKEFINSIG
jgi:aspartate/methionine/tyrosine aminotransferase